MLDEYIHIIYIHIYYSNALPYGWKFLGTINFTFLWISLLPQKLILEILLAFAYKCNDSLISP